MPRPLAALFVLLLLLGAGLWWGTRSERRPTAPEAGSAPAAGNAASELGGLAAAPVVAVEETRRPLEGAAPLEFGPDDLVVDVVDEERLPVADVRVYLERAPSTGDGARSGVSDGYGRIVFVGQRAELRRTGERWALHDALPREEPAELELTEELLAQPTLDYVLPPGGPIELRVRVLEGLAEPTWGRVELALAGERPGADEPPVTWGALIERGRVRFPWVELGRGWEVTGIVPLLEQPTRLLFPGPTRAREAALVELVLGSDHPVLGLRAVDPAGRALGDVELALDRAEGTVRRRTDGAGRFALDGVLEGELTLRLDDKEHGARAGRVLVERALAPGWNEFGDVVFAPETP